MIGNYFMLHYVPDTGNVFHYYETSAEALEAIKGKYQRSMNKSFLWMFARQENHVWLELDYDHAIPYLTAKIESDKIAATVRRLEKELEPLINTDVPKLNKKIEDMRSVGMDDDHDWVKEMNQELRLTHDKVKQIKDDIEQLRESQLALSPQLSVYESGLPSSNKR